MEMIEVIGLAHFEDTRIGAMFRKQRLKIPMDVAEHLISMGLVAHANPMMAVAQRNPLTDPLHDGVEQLSQSSPADQALPKRTRRSSRRNSEQMVGASLL